ncbi:MAG TPA: pentapeptide repeat-containing protein [Isosphaeraceae bacterium]
MIATKDPTQDAFGQAPPNPTEANVPERLRGILDEHRAWLASGRTTGRGADLRGADLRGVDLRRQDLRGAQLQQADLTGAQLLGADLAGTDFFEANLKDAVLRDADLQDADLSGAKGLLGGQLGGADLAGAKLPANLQNFESLALVAEVSKSTQNLFTSIVLVCAYTWLTIASTTDAQLLNNAAPPSSRLPILGIDIPLVRFYAAAPLLLLCLYVYLHLGLQRLWEELADLPAVFPDGRPLDKKAYPWLLNVLIRAHAPRLADRRTHLSRWQAGISVLLAWGLVPVTILVLWGRYLRSHDWSVTALHVVLLSVVAGFGVAFLRLASRTLRGSERRPFLWQKAWKDARGLGGGVAVALFCVLYLLSLGVIEGVNPELAQRLADQGVIERTSLRYSALDVRRWVPILLTRIGYSPSAALDDVYLSTKPANWSPLKPELEAVKGADLERRNLRFAKAYGSFCINAYLRKAEIQWSDFREADLRRADLRGAHLTGANFRAANLQEADLRGADGSGARFKDALLDKALVQEANLQGANFSCARLPGSDLSGADLRGADLQGAKLHMAQMTEAELSQPARLCGANLRGANLREADLRGAKLDRLEPGEGVPARPTQLCDAQLQGADLTGADLTGADLSGADLHGTILRGTDLTEVTGLTRQPLETAVADDQTRLPTELRALAWKGAERR